MMPASKHDISDGWHDMGLVKISVVLVTAS